jgi:acetyl esterase/lipase
MPSLYATEEITMNRRATLAILASIAASAPCIADPVELSTFVALPGPEPTLQVRYGEAPSQAIDVFVPSGSGPHPVAILIHGGCWSTTAAGREQLRHLGADLIQRGIAVWSIGYRRANEPGGGYPGTFQDVGAAIDRLREDAPTHGLDLSRTVLVGHSAGGHLALWAAAQRVNSCCESVAYALTVHARCGDQLGRSGRSRKLRPLCPTALWERHP